jgi:HlyD family secretion protein
MKRTLLTLVVVAAIAGSAYAYYNFRKTGPVPSVATTQVTRGDIVDTVGATGTLQAVTTVQVGTQVSGTILSLYADFNSLVRKGQVLARLDPSLFQTQIEQARANLLRSQADVERLRVGLEDARTKLARARELAGRQLLPQSDLDAAEVAVRSAEAQLRSAEAQVTQAQASLNQNQVNLDHTVINAPIDGLVISRNVDTGQTVAASMQAPTLFVLAADLTKMQVVANLDESDVGRIRPGQEVSFRVDAYPTDTFHGAVSQVRLNPLVQQNVVTYATVIDVPNDELKLKPGMTANVNIEIARRTNVLRVPNAALRFRPTPEMYAALGLTPADPNQRNAGGGGGTRRGGSGRGTDAAGADEGKSPTAGPAKTAQPADQTSSAPADFSRGSDSGRRRTDAAPASGSRGGSGADQGAAPGGAGRSRFAERLQGMSSEERAQALQRMRDRGVDPDAPRGRGDGGAAGATTDRSQRDRSRSGTPVAADPKTARASGATTIDALFGPLPKVETTGRAWVYADKKLEPVRLRLGVSDGQATEIIEGALTEGSAVVTNIALGDTRPPATNGFPFGQPGRGGFPGGGFPGGGGNRGGAGGNRGGGR